MTRLPWILAAALAATLARCWHLRQELADSEKDVNNLRWLVADYQHRLHRKEQP